MYAKELIGKTCIREKPVIIERFARVESGIFTIGAAEKKVVEPDYTYCKEPVKIIAATDHNIICERNNILGKAFIANLDERYCDDAWVDYGAMLEGYEPEDPNVAKGPVE